MGPYQFHSSHEVRRGGQWVSARLSQCLQSGQFVVTMPGLELEVFSSLAAALEGLRPTVGKY